MHSNLQKASAIKSKEVYDFIDNAVKSEYLYSNWIVKEYLNTYFEWIQSSRLNNFHGLKKFNSLISTFSKDLISFKAFSLE